MGIAPSFHLALYRTSMNITRPCGSTSYVANGCESCSADMIGAGTEAKASIDIVVERVTLCHFAGSSVRVDYSFRWAFNNLVSHGVQKIDLS